MVASLVESSLPITLSAPAEPCENSADPAGLSRPNLGGRHSKLARDFRDGHTISPSDEPTNLIFPCVRFEAAFLLWLDVLALEFIIRPPFLTGAVAVDGLREELISVMREGV